MDLPRLSFDDDPGRARTLPAAIHRDPATAAALVERVLARSWHVVASGPERPAPGEHVARTLLPGVLDEPVLLGRDGQGEVRGLSNVCTHRGSLLVEGRCAAATIRCPYHGRRFAPDGRCLGGPGFEAAPDFPAPADDLPTFPVGELGPLLFASPRPAVGFEAFAAPVRRLFGFAGTERLPFSAADSRDYEVEAPWTLYVENYLEGLHVPFVHPSLGRALDLRTYRVAVDGESVLQVGDATDPADALELPAGHPEHGSGAAALYLWLFPTTMWNLYPWGLSVNVVEPLGPARTRVRFLSFVRDARRRGDGAGADLDRVEREDEAIVVRAFRGVRSRLYDRGRLAPGHEDGVLHFHRLLARYGNEAADGLGARPAIG